VKRAATWKETTVTQLHIPPAKIDFSAAARQQILANVEAVLVSGHLTQGRFVEALETRFAEYLGASQSVAVNSGTSALEILLRIGGVEGREVIVPSNTFFATAAAVIHAGGRPRFADIEPETFGLDLDSAIRLHTRHTAGVILVHIGGIITPRVDAIRDWCRTEGLFLLEDAAHAHGSRLDGRWAGTLGDGAAFSFYPTKVMTCGEGGMVVTQKEEVAREARIYRDQGKATPSANYHIRLGANWRMSEFHAVVGLSQLETLEEAIEARIRIAHLYDAELSGLSRLHLFPMPQGLRPNYYKYIAMLDARMDRSRLKELLRQQYGIALSGEVYDTPCHLQPIFQAYNEGPLPVVEDVCRRHICLPIYPGMTSEEVRYVTAALREVLA
jgi:dTDP-4-amino-4,6-dideoxygalactose transaminase